MTAMSSLVGARYALAERRLRRPSTPAELAVRIVPKYRITPAGALASDAFKRALDEPGQRIIIAFPPREGKSTLVAVVGTLFALMEDPDTEVVLASYADTLAQEHSHTARALINENREMLGYSLSTDKTAVGRWKVDGKDGGLLAAGILSGITGFGADLLVIDDVIKNQQEADSEAHRKKVVHEFRSTLMTRLHPGSSVVIIGTRWHEKDLIGSLLAEEGDRWTYINVPAVAEAGVPDALEREPGVSMTSALGRSPAEFEELKRTVGSRAWYALFQGVPSSPEGGLVKRAWLDDWRLPAAPGGAVYTVVAVDPSDSGEGDECGIVAMSRTSGGVAAVIADVSAPYTSDKWAQAAVDLAVAVGASEIAVEAFAARETYTRVVREAIGRAKVDRPMKVTGWPPKGSGRGGGDAVARSSALLQALEVGTCRLAGHFPALEDQAVLWQSGQHQPDRLAAMTVGYDVLVHAAGGVWLIAAPPSGSLGGQSPLGPAGGVASMADYLRRRVG